MIRLLANLRLLARLPRSQRLPAKLLLTTATVGSSKLKVLKRAGAVVITRRFGFGVHPDGTGGLPDVPKNREILGACGARHRRGVGVLSATGKRGPYSTQKHACPGPCN